MLDWLPNIVGDTRPRAKGIIAFLCGAVSTLALPPFFIWPILFLTFPALIWLLDGIAFARPVPLLRRISSFAFVGWAFGFGYFLAGIHWVGFSFLSNPTPYPVLTRLGMVAAVLALCAALGLFYALASSICAILWRPGSARLSAFAFAFFIAELARSTILSGFPWNLFGVALTSDDVAMQAASAVGVNGLTLAALFVFPVLATVFARKRAQPKRTFAPVGFALAILIGIYGFGFIRLHNATMATTNLRVRIVQPNIPQREKYLPANQGPIVDKLFALSKSGTSGEDISGFDYVVWPESSLPFLLAFNTRFLYPAMKDRLAGLLPAKTRLILGAERAEGATSGAGAITFERVFNSLFLLTANGEIGDVYDKVHLVPFGEYIPLESVLKFLNISALSHRLDSFTSGSIRKKTVGNSLRNRFAPVICYEVIFPGSIARGNERPAWIVNVTNDAWFGTSTGPSQHFHLARIRAVEEGIPLVRSANTGISAIVNAYGIGLITLPLNRSGTLDGFIPSVLTETFQSRWRLVNNIIFLLFPLQLYLFNVFRDLQ